MDFCIKNCCDNSFARRCAINGPFLSFLNECHCFDYITLLIFLFLQAQNAERRGAKALIIYSDPADYASDGVNKTYPDYRWLSSDGVQRGNLWMVKGDPLTPGYPATGKYMLQITLY
jgi:hypothetical protein